MVNAKFQKVFLWKTRTVHIKWHRWDLNPKSSAFLYHLKTKSMDSSSCDFLGTIYRFKITFPKNRKRPNYYSGQFRFQTFGKQVLRQPGVEPGSQEWESCLIPLHHWHFGATMAMYFFCLKFWCICCTSQPILRCLGNSVEAFCSLAFVKDTDRFFELLLLKA